MQARLTVVFALVTQVALSRLLPGQAGNPDSLAARVDSVFATWDHTNTPGCALGVSRGGVTILERGYGMANLEYGLAITPASIFHVASISKQFTAMAVLLLAQRGQLSLDDDVRKYIPELPSYGDRITLRHLLTHTSGLRDQWDLLGLAGWREDDLITEDDVLQIVIRQRGLNFRPGTQYLYSNTGFTLLAIIVKRVSGQTLRAFADSNIFQPLGMTHTHFHDDHTMLVPNRTSAYQPRASGGWKVSIPVFDTYGATSLFTTTGDLLRWEQNFADPKVGGPELVASMQVPTLLAGGDTSLYGFGLFMERFHGLRAVGHDGADAGYRASVVRFPDQGLAVTALCNLSDIDPSTLTRAVAALYLRDAITPEPPVTTASTPPASVKLSTAQLAVHAGVYYNPVNDAIRRVVMRDSQLVYARGPGFVLTPVGEHRFQIPERPITIEFVPATPNTRQQMRVLVQGDKPVVYQRMPSFTPSAGQLAPFAGEYASDELEITYTLAVQDSGLVIRTRKGADIAVHAVFADAFQGDDIGLLKFTRDGRSRVTGFTVNTGRVRGVRFERVR